MGQPDTVLNSNYYVTALAVLVLFLPACSTLNGSITNSTYVSPDGEFSAWVPPLLDVECRDGAIGTTEEYVDCTTGHGYWNTQDGGYSLEWHKASHRYESEDEFYATSERVLPQLVHGSAGKSFLSVRSAKLTVNGRAAYQIVMRGNKDKIPSLCVATSINFGYHVAVAYLLVPIKSDTYPGPANAAQASTWKYYPKFLDSIEQRATNSQAQ